MNKKKTGAGTAQRRHHGIIIKKHMMTTTGMESMDATQNDRHGQQRTMEATHQTPVIIITTAFNNKIGSKKHHMGTEKQYQKRNQNASSSSKTFQVFHRHKFDLQIQPYRRIRHAGFVGMGELQAHRRGATAKT